MVLRELEEMYHSYQLAYDHLILEMDRRSQYRNAVQSLVDETAARLQALRTGMLTPQLLFLGSNSLLTMTRLKRKWKPARDL